jgi:hypothetical protein
MPEWSEMSKKEKLDHLQKQLGIVETEIKRSSEAAGTAVMMINHRLEKLEQAIKSAPSSPRKPAQRATTRKRVVTKRGKR